MELIMEDKSNRCSGKSNRNMINLKDKREERT